MSEQIANSEPSRDSSSGTSPQSGRPPAATQRKASDDDGADAATRPSISLTKPTTGQLVARGFTRRCPWCGDRKAYFTSWWGRAEHCRQCGRGYRRGDDAFELGAITVNIIFTFLGILISLVIIFWLLLGTDVDVSTPMLIGIGGFFVLLAPVLFYPLTFTVWQAVDLIMREPTEEELAGGSDARL